MSTIITRNSATSGSTPSSLVQGELAINVKDGRLFYGSGSGNIVKEFNSVTSASYAITSSYTTYAETASYSANASDIIVRVLNQSGNNIAKGVVVRITGSNNSSDIPRIVTASYENDNNSANTLGITREAIPNGSEGYVITEGVLIGINTTAFTSGQLIYLGATGSIIGTAPVAPLHAVRLGEVIRHQSNNGSVYVRIDNGYELGELHDVKDTTTTSSFGDLFIKSGSVWTNSKQLTGSYGLTGSLEAISFTGSLSGTSSYALTASYVDGMPIKSNAIDPSLFSGTPLIASVNFTTPYPDSNYSVLVTGEDARVWTIESKTNSGFSINSNSNVALTGDTFWQSISYGEFNS